MDMPPEAERRIAEDQVAWLTTVTDRGAPAPNPVWFVPDGGDLVVFSERDTRKVHKIERRPAVALHFNSDPAGGDVVVVTGEVERRTTRSRAVLVDERHDQRRWSFSRAKKQSPP